jgi:hypothetical protein
LWISSSEADNGTGDGNTSGDIVDAVTGTDDVDFQLRAERAAWRGPRVQRAVPRHRRERALLRRAGARARATTAATTAVDGGDYDDWKHDVVQARKAAKKAAAQMKAAKQAAKLQEGVQPAARRADRIARMLIIAGSFGRPDQADEVMAAAAR